MPKVLFGLLAFAPCAAGHGAAVYPPPRNAVDRSLDTWSGAVPEPVIRVSAEGGWWCPVASTGEGKYSASNGQACFWFSNGCFIGCPSCDGDTRLSGKKEDQVCEQSKHNVTATICDKKLRTINVDAPCGSESDYTYYSPWRAPGSSAVFDACGMAGGRAAPGPHGTTFKETIYARQGDLGSKTLKPMPTGITWEAGSVVEVSWGITANHGGGYQYRLCPANGPLTEECFQQRPLPFVGQQAIRRGGRNATKHFFDGDYISEGTVPKGSTWAKNPIPRNTGSKPAFPPHCQESPDCQITGLETTCLCSGLWGPYDLEIVDTVQLPNDLDEGEWVLGWRNDCEATSQVWNSCSDVTIVKPGDAVV